MCMDWLVKTLKADADIHYKEQGKYVSISVSGRQYALHAKGLGFSHRRHLQLKRSWVIGAERQTHAAVPFPIRVAKTRPGRYVLFYLLIDLANLHPTFHS